MKNNNGSQIQFSGIFIAYFVFTTFIAGCGGEFSLGQLQRKAQRGDAKAQRELGQAFLTGAKGASLNAETAAQWFTKAADRGDAMAQLFLAQQYTKGNGVPKDEAKAISYFRKAAEQNIAGAQHALGVRYTLGQGVTKDFKEAVKWYQKAAEQGLAEAQLSLALRHARGEGVPVSDSEAVKWYRRAAEQGVHDAQVQMAQRSAIGEGVSRDLAEAYKWATIVGDSRTLEKISKQMKPEQIKEAEAKVAAFQPLLETAVEDPPESNALLYALGAATVGLYGTAFYIWWKRRRNGNGELSMENGK